MRTAAVVVLAAGLAGCVSAPAERPGVAPPVPLPAAGLERVMGVEVAQLTRLLGQPDADVQEGAARKLQFGSAICVLDAYLYPKSAGRSPVVTYVDARQRDGSAIDRASCLAALARRKGGK